MDKGKVDNLKTRDNVLQNLVKYTMNKRGRLESETEDLVIQRVQRTLNDCNILNVSKEGDAMVMLLQCTKTSLNHVKNVKNVGQVFSEWLATPSFKKHNKIKNVQLSAEMDATDYYRCLCYHQSKGKVP